MTNMPYKPCKIVFALFLALCPMPHALAQETDDSLNTLELPEGMQTQEIASEGGTTARLDGMKMVMIDTTDPASLKEENTLEIDADFSQALYNHKAVLVDQARDLIAFPAEGNYLVYGYSAEQGFQLKKEITFENEWDWQSRGLYIGDCFYVVSSDCIYTIDLNTLENVGQTILSRG